jgi:hypothetical protein
MTDNLGYTPGSGATVATENSGGVHHQRVLMETAVEGVPTDVSVYSPMPVVSSRSDDLLVMLSRIVKLLESNATVDSASRQRVALDALIAPLNVVGNGISAAAMRVTLANDSAGILATVSSLTNMVSNAGMDREQYINIAKQTYSQGIRSGLTFQ